MHVSASCKTAAISENNATLEDLKSTQDDVLPQLRAKPTKVMEKLHIAGIFNINFVLQAK